MTAPLLSLRKLSCHFRQGRDYLAAVDDVSLDIFAGEVLALVGESGSGKSTLGRLIAGLEEPSFGEMRFQGQSLAGLRGLKHQRGVIQMVFQDSYASLDPRMRIVDSLAEPLRDVRLPSDALRKRIDSWLDRVGLGARFADRFPHELSGGQRQRVGIARAFIAEPKLVICDEAVSALDVSVQAQVLSLLRDIQRDSGTAMLFITHDLAVLPSLADRIAVMYLGELLELGTTAALINAPMHPYTRQLLAAHPEPNLDAPLALPVRTGASELPLPLSRDRGCRFANRCPYVDDACRLTPPVSIEKDAGHFAACHRLTEIEAVAASGGFD